MAFFSSIPLTLLAYMSRKYAKNAKPDYRFCFCPFYSRRYCTTVNPPQKDDRSARFLDRLWLTPSRGGLTDNFSCTRISLCIGISWQGFLRPIFPRHHCAGTFLIRISVTDISLTALSVPGFPYEDFYDRYFPAALYRHILTMISITDIS